MSSRFKHATGFHRFPAKIYSTPVGSLMICLWILTGMDKELKERIIQAHKRYYSDSDLVPNTVNDLLKELNIIFPVNYDWIKKYVVNDSIYIYSLYNPDLRQPLPIREDMQMSGIVVTAVYKGKEEAVGADSEI